MLSRRRDKRAGAAIGTSGGDAPVCSVGGGGGYDSSQAGNVTSRLSIPFDLSSHRLSPLHSMDKTCGQRSALLVLDGGSDEYPKTKKF